MHQQHSIDTSLLDQIQPFMQMAQTPGRLSGIQNGPGMRFKGDYDCRAMDSQGMALKLGQHLLMTHVNPVKITDGHGPPPD